MTTNSQLSTTEPKKEAKKLICTTHAHELGMGRGILEGTGVPGRRG